jgi:hypothetical protein
MMPERDADAGPIGGALVGMSPKLGNDALDGPVPLADPGIGNESASNVVPIPPAPESSDLIWRECCPPSNSGGGAELISGSSSSAIKAGSKESDATE